MTRLTALLSAFVLLAAACGGGDADTAEDVIAELGLGDAQLACYESEYADRGLDMDAILASNPDDLSAAERQTVIDIAAGCAAAEAIADADTASDDGDATSDDTASDDGDTETTTTTEAAGEDTSGTRSYEDLGFLEQAFVDGITESGGTVAAGICILDEFEANGIEIFDLAQLDTNEPPPEVLSAIFACGEELLESDLFAGGGDTGGDDSADTYGDDAAFDALWDACAAEDYASCDVLWLQSPIGSEYEAFGSTCGQRTTEQFGGCEATFATTTPTGDYGDDPFLDGLWDRCAAGELAACDELWFESPIGSRYEAFGNTCGDRETNDRFGNCDSGEPMRYGESAELDTLWDSCGGGDLDACDELYITSPIGSDYEAFGNTCGGRSADDLFGECAATLN